MFLRTDNGGEYVDGDFLAFYKQKGITRQFYGSHTPKKMVCKANEHNYF